MITSTIEDDVTQIAETVATNTWLAWLWVAVAVAGGALLAFVVTWVFRTVTGSLQQRIPLAAPLRKRFPKPLFWLVAVLAWLAVVPPFIPNDFDAVAGGVRYGLQLSLIGVIGWIIAKALILLIDGAMLRQQSTAPDQYARRRRETQIAMIRRLVIAVVAVLTVGAMLVTIPGARTVGASLIASAGVASIVAGLAAQSTLGNLVAGIQLAFSNGLKVGDTVEVDDKFGTIEEITLTSVILRIWDERRHVLPSTYFTTTPYTNWTRNQSEVMGTVFVQADYSIDVEAVRAELNTILDGAPEWDRRSGGLIVSEARNGVAELRATMTAADGGALWDLQCLVREKLVAFIANHRPGEVSRTRVQQMPAAE